jgi:FkbM family methyltransferase
MGNLAIGQKLPKCVQRRIFNSKSVMAMLGQKYFGTEELDRKLLEFLSPEKPGYFIEIGANNGIAQSNTKHLELYYGWSGLLVEPWKPNFERLNVTRSSRSNFVHAACVSFSYPHEQVSLYYSNLLTIAEGVESEKPDAFAWAKGAEFLIPNQGKVTQFLAPARTLTSLLEKAKAPEVIQLFSLDVEGAEIEVLKGLDFGRYKFEVLCVESDSISEIEGFLGERGYKQKCQVSFHDYIFVPR